MKGINPLFPMKGINPLFFSGLNRTVDLAGMLVLNLFQLEFSESQTVEKAMNKPFHYFSEETIAIHR